MERKELVSRDDPHGQVIQVMATMKAVVDEYGRDHRYQPRPNAGYPTGDQVRCWYVNADKTGPDCLVGHVLYRLGVSLDTLSECEQSPPYTASGHRLSNRAEDVLLAAQALQDLGHTWGEAYDRAYLRAHEMYPDDFPNPVTVSKDNG